MSVNFIPAISRLEKNSGVVLVALILAMIFAGTIYSFVLGNDLRYPDEREYYQIARNMALSGNFSLDGEKPTAYRPPGYSFFLAPFVLLGAAVPQLRILNCVLLAACMFLMYRIVKEQASALAGLGAAIGVLCYPVLFYTAGTLFPQILGACLLLLIIHLLTRKIVLKRDCVLAGIAFGCLILTIPFFVFMLAPFAVWLYWTRVNPWRTGVAAFLVTALVLPCVWSARNYIVFDTFVFVSANSGDNLLLGNSERAGPNTGVSTDIARYRDQSRQMGLDPVERDDYFKTKAIEWIWGNKVQAVQLYCLKLVNYFNYRNQLWVDEEASSVKDLLMLFTYGPLLGLCLVRVCMLKRFKLSSFEILLLGLYVFSALVYAVFFTRIRFRLPFDFLLICVAAMFLRSVFVASGFRGVSGLPAKEAAAMDVSSRELHPNTQEGPRSLVRTPSGSGRRI